MPNVPTARTVTVAMTVRAVAPDVVPGIPTVFGYDPADPWAVSLTFIDDDNRWRFGRDLLAAGLGEPSGYGDVRVWPARRRFGDRVVVALSPPDGDATFEAPRSAVARFLDRSYKAVPRGTEADHVDLDQVVSRLLTEA